MIEVPPNPAKAKSMLEAAERRLQFIKKVPVTEESADIVSEKCYDSFRMLGDALLIARGKKSARQGHHRTALNELLTLHARTELPLTTLLNLQELRRKIEYDGYQATISEAENAITVTNTCFQPLLEAVRKEIKK